jgi:hypothetical protein
MTEIEVRENRFYVLRIKREKVEEITIHGEIGSSIRRIRDALKEGVDPDRVELMSIEIKGEKFEIKGVPWSIIAVELVRGVKE